MMDQKVSLRQLMAALQDAQAQGWQWITKEEVERICTHLEASPLCRPTWAEPQQVIEQPQGCQHVHTVTTATLNNPGGKLCVDCNQAIP